MKLTIAVAGALAVAAGLSVAISRQSSAEEANPASGQASAVARGARAWADNCGSCHNVRSPQDLSDSEWGVAGLHMRARANLPGDVANDIIAFLKASNEEQQTASVTASGTAAVTVPRSGDAARGAQIYSETCVACHGADGRGVIDGVPDFTIPSGRLAKSDETLLNNMINGFQSPGSSMAMPPRGGNPDLTDQDMADVLVYLRAINERE